MITTTHNYFNLYNSWFQYTNLIGWKAYQECIYFSKPHWDIQSTHMSLLWIINQQIKTVFKTDTSIMSQIISKHCKQYFLGI